MDSKEKYDYWLEAAQYDLESARVMMNGGRYMYVAFMSQQAIEKIVKGLYSLYTEKEPPMIHNIWSIFKQLNNEVDMVQHIPIVEYEEKLKEYKYFFAELLSYDISRRYPSFKEKISSSINYDRAERVLEKIEEVFLWIKSLSQYKMQ